MNVLMSSDKSTNHKITDTIHVPGLTDIPYSAYFSFFISFIFKMLKCSRVPGNVFECFCVLILQLFVTDYRGHWRVPLLLCAYELHGLLVLVGLALYSAAHTNTCRLIRSIRQLIRV